MYAVTPLAVLLSFSHVNALRYHSLALPLYLRYTMSTYYPFWAAFSISDVLTERGTINRGKSHNLSGIEHAFILMFMRGGITFIAHMLLISESDLGYLGPYWPFAYSDPFDYLLPSLLAFHI